MNKNEQNRVVAWRLKLLPQASDSPRSVAQTCRHFASAGAPRASRREVPRADPRL